MEACGYCLVVDDEPGLAETWAWFIAQQCPRTRVRALDDPSSALAWVREGNPVDTLVTDINMPGMTGLDLATLVREECPEVNVLFVTGDVGQWYERATRVCGARVLAKPFRLAHLAAEVAALRTGPVASAQLHPDFPR